MGSSKQWTQSRTSILISLLYPPSPPGCIEAFMCGRHLKVQLTWKMSKCSLTSFFCNLPTPWWTPVNWLWESSTFFHWVGWYRGNLLGIEISSPYPPMLLDPLCLLRSPLKYILSVLVYTRVRFLPVVYKSLPNFQYISQPAHVNDSPEAVDHSD